MATQTYKQISRQSTRREEYPYEPTPQELEAHSHHAELSEDVTRFLGDMAILIDELEPAA